LLSKTEVIGQRHEIAIGVDYPALGEDQVNALELSRMKRFSLRTALISTALMAFILGFVLLQTRYAALLREVAGLRAEMGHLVPADYSRVNVIEVPGTDEYSWRWRVFAPPGTQFEAGIATEKIPLRGVPSPSIFGVEIPSEQHGVLMTASITNDLDAGYVLKLDFGNGNVIRCRTTQSRDEFIDGSATLATAGQHGPQVGDFNEPIILHRRRLHEQTSPTTHGEPSGNSHGLMFWITPRQKP
jgi:hypothetical protein